jgi:hypothetical protein
MQRPQLIEIFNCLCDETRRHEQWMIYSLPAEQPRELHWQRRCLQDCLPTHSAFRDDLRQLKARQPDCCWVAEAFDAAPTAPSRSTKTKRTLK